MLVFTRAPCARKETYWPYCAVGLMAASSSAPTVTAHSGATNTSTIGPVMARSMQDMALIGPHTILVADVVRKDGWRVEGVPITVRSQAAKD